MVSSIKEWVIPYVDKLANSQGQGQQRMNEDMYAYRPTRNGLEPPRMGENQSWYEPMRNEPFKVFLYLGIRLQCIMEAYHKMDPQYLR